MSRRYIDKHIRPFQVVEYYEQDEDGFYAVEDYDAPDVSVSVKMSRVHARKLFDDTLKEIKNFSYKYEQYSSVAVFIVHMDGDYRVVVIDSCDGHSINPMLEESSKCHMPIADLIGYLK